MTPTRATPLLLGSLTDAELALLTRSRTRVGPRPVMPVWSRLDSDRRTAAARRARADLVSRRLLEPGTPAGLRRDLRSLLALRGAAPAVVAVVRTTPGGRDHWYAHVVRDVVVLEQVTADAVHAFSLAAAVTLPDLVAAAVLRPGAPLLRADVELRTVTGSRRWAWGPATPQLLDPDGLGRQVGDALAALGAGEVDDVG